MVMSDMENLDFNENNNGNPYLMQLEEEIRKNNGRALSSDQLLDFARKYELTSQHGLTISEISTDMGAIVRRINREFRESEESQHTTMQSDKHKFSFFDELGMDSKMESSSYESIASEKHRQIENEISRSVSDYGIDNALNDSFQSKTNIRKRRIRLIIASLIFIAIYGLIIITTPAIDKNQKNKRVQAFMNTSADEEEVLNKFLDDDALVDNEDVYKLYCSEMLGIDNNKALAGQTKSIPENENYENILKNKRAWLDGGQLKLDIRDNVVKTSNDEGVIISDNADEPILTSDYLYYIDSSSGRKLKQYRLSDGAQEVLESANIKQYAVYGKYLIALGDDWNLRKINTETKESKILVGNIQRFFAGSNLVAQNGDKIITVSLDGSHCEDLIDGAMLEGYNNRVVYFVKVSSTDENSTESEISRSINQEIVDKYHEELTLNDGSIAVYSYNIDTGEIKLEKECEKMVRAVYVVDGNVLVDTL